MPNVLVQVLNSLRSSDAVDGAAVTLTALTATGTPAVGTAIAWTTNRYGIVRLNTTGLADGRHVLSVMPANTSADPVGPNTAETGPAPDRIYRSLDVDITTRAGLITAASVPAGTLNGSVSLTSAPRLNVKLQPVWMKSPNRTARGGSSAVDLIIVHHTGGAAIGGAINHFMNGTGAGRASAGYIIDTDGQIVKMVRDSEAAWQAGTSYWHPRNGVNATSIGIEIVHSSGPYQAAQYTSLIGLLNALVRARGVARKRIVGHSDIGTNDSGRLGRKSTDPGSTFLWSKLESQNLSLGIGRTAGPVPPTFPGDFHVQFPAGSLRSGDNDKRRRFGGAVRSTVTGNPVQEIQEALQRIGYSVGTPDGDFGQKTAWAVQMFQQHFHEMGLTETAQVNAATASAIWMLS